MIKVIHTKVRLCYQFGSETVTERFRSAKTFCRSGDASIKFATCKASMLLVYLYTYTAYNEFRFFSIARDHEIHETRRIQAFRETSIQRFHILLKESERTGVGKGATVCMFYGTPSIHSDFRFART